MDWTQLHFDWNHARAFLATAQAGSYSAAAAKLKVSQPTLSRQVAALEEELGVALFERAGRGIEPTPTGLDLIEHVQAMAEAANQLALSASGHANSLSGTVCLSVTETMAFFVLAPLLKKLRATHRGIHFEVVVSNQASDLRRREADIAIRHVEPTHPELIARKLPQLFANLYAHESYLDSLGAAPDFATLSQAQYIGFADNQRLLDMLQSLGLALTKDNFAILTENHLLHWSLIQGGFGIGIMPESIAEGQPGIRKALPEFPPLPYDTWLVTHRELRTNRRIKTVYDFLADALFAQFQTTT